MSRTGPPRRRWPDGGEEVAWSWVTARVLVAVGALVAVVIADRLVPGARPFQLTQGLLSWDGGWYQAIAEEGYGALPAEALRFFPLYPLLGRLVGVALLGREGAALLVVANVAAAGAGLLLFALVRHEGLGAATARRAVWLLFLLPPSFVLVFAYAESLFLCGALAAFLALRRRAWWWAALFGALAALARPVGVLLVLPAAVEVVRGWHRASAVERAGGVAAVAGPLVGVGAYLVWAGVRFGDWLEPLRVQEQFRGDATNPIARLAEGLGDLFGPERLGDGLHLPFALAFVVLVVAAFRFLPVSYGLFAAAVLVVALAAENLNSLERYALNAFPIVMALAALVARPRAEQIAFLVSAAGLVGLTALALTGAYVP